MSTGDVKWEQLLTDLSTFFKYFESVDVLWALAAGAIVAFILAGALWPVRYGTVLLMAFIFVSCVVLAITTIFRRWAWRRRNRNIANESVINQTKGW